MERYKALQAGKTNVADLQDEKENDDKKVEFIKSKTPPEVDENDDE